MSNFWENPQSFPNLATQILSDSYNWDIGVIMPLFCDISGIGTYEITGLTFLIVVDELQRGCNLFFLPFHASFFKIREVFRIRTCGPYSEHPKCKKKGGKITKKEISS